MNSQESNERSNSADETRSRMQDGKKNDWSSRARLKRYESNFGRPKISYRRPSRTCSNAAATSAATKLKPPNQDREEFLGSIQDPAQMLTTAA